MKLVDRETGIAIRIPDPPLRLVIDSFMWECNTQVYRDGRLSMFGYSEDFPADCAEQQTRGCQVRYGFNVFEAYVAKLTWSAILIQYPLDKDLFYALRWEL